MTDPAPSDRPVDPAAFARQFQEFLGWVHETSSSRRDGAVTVRLAAHLGLDPVGVDEASPDTAPSLPPVVARDLPPFEQVNLQIALEAWRSDRSIEVLGWSVPLHHPRPGRVDVAIEIGLPDADARRRLLEVYSRGAGLRAGPEDVDAVVEGTEGVTASFIKELVRRTVLEALLDDAADGRATGAHLRRALADLLDSTQGVTRALLGVPQPQV